MIVRILYRRTSRLCSFSRLYRWRFTPHIIKNASGKFHSPILNIEFDESFISDRTHEDEKAKVKQLIFRLLVEFTFLRTPHVFAHCEYLFYVQADSWMVPGNSAEIYGGIQVSFYEVAHDSCPSILMMILAPVCWINPVEHFYAAARSEMTFPHTPRYLIQWLFSNDLYSHSTQTSSEFIILEEG